MEIVRGIPVSAGIAIGNIHIINQEEYIIREIHLASDDKVEREVALFEGALKRTRLDLQTFKKTLQRHLGENETAIFDAHLHILSDVALTEKTIVTIRKERKNAAFAFKKTVEEIVHAMQSIKDQYLQERVYDIKDVYHRVLNHLLEDFAEGADPMGTDQPVILVAHTLSPYEFIHFERRKILGVITEIGGETSHFSIIARSLEIPTVVGCENILFKAKSGDSIIVDGKNGWVILNPDTGTLGKYEKAQKRHFQIGQQLYSLKDLPSITLDGKTIDISANIELPSELSMVLQHGCRNIGLCRTEFLYLLKNRPPTEQEQYRIYRNYLEKMYPGYVIIRTMDLGGDKIGSSAADNHEANPAIGWRAIRICLDDPTLFRTQLRAILRASAFGNCKIMFPMISTLEELQQTLKFYRKVRTELLEEKVEINPEIEIGIMIEVPAAALCADALAREVDFFSIGTNDLVQFMLAVDRGNKKIAHLFDPHNPAVLKIIKQVIDAAHNNGIWVGVCGEMASHPLSALLLLGMGVDELSMNSLSVLEMKKIIRAISFDEIRAGVEKAISLETSKKISLFLQRDLKSKVHLTPKFAINP